MEGSDSPLTLWVQAEGFDAHVARALSDIGITTLAELQRFDARDLEAKTKLPANVSKTVVLRARAEKTVFVYGAILREEGDEEEIRAKHCEEEWAIKMLARLLEASDDSLRAFVERHLTQSLEFIANALEDPKALAVDERRLRGISSLVRNKDVQIRASLGSGSADLEFRRLDDYTKYGGLSTMQARAVAWWVEVVENVERKKGTLFAVSVTRFPHSRNFSRPGLFCRVWRTLQRHDDYDLNNFARRSKSALSHALKNSGRETPPVILLHVRENDRISNNLKEVKFADSARATLSAAFGSVFDSDGTAKGDVLVLVTQQHWAFEAATAVIEEGFESLPFRCFSAGMTELLPNPADLAELTGFPDISQYLRKSELIYLRTKSQAEFLSLFPSELRGRASQFFELEVRVKESTESSESTNAEMPSWSVRDDGVFDLGADIGPKRWTGCSGHVCVEDVLKDLSNEFRSKVRQLWLRGDLFSDEDVDEIDALVRAFPNLVLLDLTSQPLNGPKSSDALCRWLKGNPGLQVILQRSPPFMRLAWTMLREQTLLSSEIERIRWLSNEWLQGPAAKAELQKYGDEIEQAIRRGHGKQSR